MDRAQLLLVGLPLFLFATDLFSLFTPPPPKPPSHHHHHHHHHPHLPKPPLNPETLDISLQKPSAIGGIGYGSTVNINFCASCSYRGTAVTMKKMLEAQFPGIDVILDNYPPSLPKRLLSKVVPVFQFGVIGIMMAGEQIFPMIGITTPPPWYYSLRANRFGSIATAWLLGNVMQSFLQSSGAFEVYCNDELVFSKLKEGRCFRSKIMGDRLRLAVGIMGNASSLLLYAAPILTFTRVIRKRSTEEFSCIPYIVALSNCLLYTWYGLPVVSYKWENFPVITINGLGIILELSFIFIYLWFAPTRGKIKAGTITTIVMVIFTVTAIISAFVFHDHHHRKVFVGTIGLVASVAMYAAPLVVVKQVIMTKSVEFMPFYLSFFSFLASVLWLAYGLLSHDLLLASPNLVGLPLGILQLGLYCKYRKRGIIEEEPSKWDLEHNNIQEKPKHMQLSMNEDINEKI